MRDFIVESIAWNNRSISKLLIQNKLPYSDINRLISFIGVRTIADNTIVGIVGLEKYRPYALLRSLAVRKDYQRKGLGNVLVNEAIRVCTAENISKVYLLTTTADEYFKRQGFVIINREMVPEEIRKTREFIDICPKSSVCMERVL